jgi:NDP-sugar pyrophosphorylase family protein
MPKIDSATDMMNSVKALLLVGGKGTRLRPIVPSTPKPLAPIGDRPFLELLIRQLRIQHIRNVVLCTGYQAEQIEQALGDGSQLDVVIEYSRETVPMGTAGAVQLARRYLQQLDDFLVLNGDSFLEIDFSRLMEFHRTHGGVATIAAVAVPNADRYGAIATGTNNRITSFAEKTGKPGSGLINGGIYVFDIKVLRHIPDGPASLERDVLPKLLPHGVYAFEQHGMFIDIGTPADYARAQELYHRISKPLETAPSGA